MRNKEDPPKTTNGRMVKNCRNRGTNYDKMRGKIQSFQAKIKKPTIGKSKKAPRYRKGDLKNYSEKPFGWVLKKRPFWTKKNQNKTRMDDLESR
ncbi:hypothetical protein TNIN_454911 [Trichonephila inaurata madagascariensis]|uniref:Uncharacterized protein n=1 Tax=Trichonephila inaurata madagascariensis TaxID=2747483 RepID=A0A8X7BMY5_9ARAC|nr:hypothetical protein TNIN_454911 [Trichonephila inaurata madagascariensis]